MKVEIDGLVDFIKVLRAIEKGEFGEQLALWLEALGMEFLDIVQDEIIRTQTVDTRRLLNSFGRGDSENVWVITNGGLTLEVGTNVEYASYVNDGHFTVGKNTSRNQRWVPGFWRGDRFIYEPNAKTGMLLTQKWVEGKHYWDYAFAIFEKMFYKSLEVKLQEWLDSLL